MRIVRITSTLFSFCFTSALAFSLSPSLYFDQSNFVFSLLISFDHSRRRHFVVPLPLPALVAHELNLRRRPRADELHPRRALRPAAVALDVRPPVALVARNHGPAQRPAHEAAVVVDVLRVPQLGVAVQVAFEKASFGTRISHVRIARIEARRLQAMGKLHSTCNFVY
jgi:hypothetical protein